VPEDLEPLGDSSAHAGLVADHMTSAVRSVAGSATLLTAARALAEQEISCLVVTEEDGAPAGIISERDLVRAAVRDPTGWPSGVVRDVMSHPLHVTAAGATVAEAIADLARLHIRRLPVMSSDGRLAGIVTQTDLLRAAHGTLQEYIHDLERVVSERTLELRELERRRDDLVDLTVHDIKNTLCVVESALDMMEQDPVGAASMIPLLRRSTLRITNLVCTLLDVNRLENGSMPLRPQEVPWATICEPVMVESGLLAQAKSIALNRSGESYSLVRCDPSLVERILLNLLDNAIGIAPERSVVDVHAERRPDGSLLVRVGNRGRVIPADELPTLFRKYRQGEERSLKRLGGWGLGLVFCRLAVERHGGTIRAISPYVNGEGAAFEFILPSDPR
jgi:signal transduction histidine kinase